jgi:hypothetical protein
MANYCEIRRGVIAGRFRFPGRGKEAILVKKNLTRGPTCQLGKEKEKKRTGEKGGCGLRPAGLVRVQLGLGPGVGPVTGFLLFFVLKPFLISVFYFFHRFCIWNPNKVKPSSKFL